MIGCLRTCVRKQPIIALYFEFENELKFYNLEAWESSKAIWVGECSALWTVRFFLFLQDNMDQSIEYQNRMTQNNALLWLCT